MNRVSLAALLLTLTGSGAWAAFRASAVEVDITPDSPQWLMGYAARQSTGVHDKIFHRIVAFDDGRTRFYIVSSDLCLFSPGVYDEVAATSERSRVLSGATSGGALLTHTRHPRSELRDFIRLCLAGRTTNGIGTTPPSDEQPD